MNDGPQIERLSKRHDRASFDCGQPVLNDWLKQQSGQFDRRDLARTYVAVEGGNPKVLGYYALSNHAVSYQSLPAMQARGLPKLNMPVALLGRLAVDQSRQGQRLGERLLLNALSRCQLIADQIGIRAVEVHAIDSTARRFYLKFGFLSLLDDEQHLLLPMEVIRLLRLPPP